MNGYLVTMVNLYHDTMPKSPDAITWPSAPVVLEDLVGGGDPDELLDELIAGGHMMVGNPEEVSEQLEAYKTVGCDQLVFGLPQDLHRDEILELLELFGDKVIPEHDPDRVHSTDRYRATATAEVPHLQPAAPRRRVADGCPGHRGRAQLSPRRPSWPLTRNA